MEETAATHPAERPIPFWRGLQARIFLTFAVVVVALVAAAVTFIVRSESDSLQRETRKRGIAVDIRMAERPLVSWTGTRRTVPRLSRAFATDPRSPLFVACLEALTVERNIAWLSTPSLLAYNYVALNQAASRSQEGSEIAYVVIYDKEGMIAADSRNENSFGNPPRDSADFLAHATREERWRFLWRNR